MLSRFIHQKATNFKRNKNKFSLKRKNELALYGVSKCSHCRIGRQKMVEFRNRNEESLCLSELLSYIFLFLGIGSAKNSSTRLWSGPGCVSASAFK